VASLLVSLDVTAVGLSVSGPASPMRCAIARSGGWRWR
jgi:hypothetical protein